MKLVVAYVDPQRFERIREVLLGLGFPSLSAVSAAGTGRHDGAAFADEVADRMRCR